MKIIDQICISRLDKMGDMILSLPAIKSIKLANPNTKICVIASNQNAKVLKNINYIDEIIEINIHHKFKALFYYLLLIRKTKFDIFLNLSPTFLSYVLCFFSNSKDKATLIFLSGLNKLHLPFNFLLKASKSSFGNTVLCMLFSVKILV